MKSNFTSKGQLKFAFEVHGLHCESSCHAARRQRTKPPSRPKAPEIAAQLTPSHSSNASEGEPTETASQEDNLQQQPAEALDSPHASGVKAVEPNTSKKKRRFFGLLKKARKGNKSGGENADPESTEEGETDPLVNSSKAVLGRKFSKPTPDPTRISEMSPSESAEAVREPPAKVSGSSRVGNVRPGRADESAGASTGPAKARKSSKKGFRSAWKGGGKLAKGMLGWSREATLLKKGNLPNGTPPLLDPRGSPSPRTENEHSCGQLAKSAGDLDHSSLKFAGADLLTISYSASISHPPPLPHFPISIFLL